MFNLERPVFLIGLYIFEYYFSFQKRNSCLKSKTLDFLKQPLLNFLKTYLKRTRISL